jgi:intracellular multiplication protein IcmC
MATDITTMIINFSNTLGPVNKLVTGLAYVMGIGLYFRAIYHLKIYGDMRTMMSSNTSIKTPIIFLLIGSVFIFMPTALSIVMRSTFGYSGINPLTDFPGYSNHNTLAMAAVLKVVQFVGLVSFIRGWMFLVNAASAHGGQPGTTGKAFTHIIGGLMAMNIAGTATLLSNTFGW